MLECSRLGNLSGALGQPGMQNAETCVTASRAGSAASIAVIQRTKPMSGSSCWAEARVKIARMTLTIKLDGNWSSFQLANSAPPLSVTDSAIAPSARI